MKRVWNYVLTMWQPAGAFVVGSIIIGMLFSYRVGNLVPGASQAEINTRTSSQTLEVILDNPVNAPYKTAQYISRHVHKSIAVERLISGLAAGLTIVLFYLIARRFCSQYAATVSTVMYALSSSLLANGRMASAQITLLLLFVLFVCCFHLRFNKHRTRSWLYSAVILGVALYTPGLIYFIIAGAIWQYRAVRRDHERPSAILLGTWCAVVIVILLPLIIGFVHTPEIWREYLGIPKSLPNITSAIKTLLSVPAGIILVAPKNPLYRLGRQPLLDIYAAAMLLFGIFALVKRYRLDRLILFSGIFILSALFTALTGNYETSFILLPFVFLTVGMGIGLLIDEWNKVFPFNPLARWMALVVMTLAVAVSCNFQARRYFIAWPHNATTKATFNIK